jgi:hypothetical protein
MRVLYPSSGNTELTDSCSQSLTTPGPLRALHDPYGSVISACTDAIGPDNRRSGDQFLGWDGRPRLLLVLWRGL